MGRRTQKGSIPKGYEAHDNDTPSVVSEPFLGYGAHTYMSPETSRTIGIMGMNNKRDLDPIQKDEDYISLIRAGIPKYAMTHLMNVAGFTLTEMANIIHTSDRTIRRYAPNQKLSQEQTERTIEIARLYGRGEEVFNGMEAFKDWMDTTLMALGNKRPKEFLDTSLGINMLMRELGRIQHGILA
jgi:putative toxin-antitoxin system antitoxin component (TIGR02293 family)